MMKSTTNMNERASSHGVVADTAELIALRHAAVGLQLGVPRRIASSLAGPYLSRIRGRGLDFEEVRPYQAGDDVRNIDWRVTARTGRVHSKVFHEERERPVWLLVDAGPSMRFGTRKAFKSVAAVRASALLAWTAQRAGDRVGGLVVSPDGLLEHSPQAREKGMLRLVGSLSRATAATGEGGAVGELLNDALGRLRAQARTGSRVFILSDFSGLDDTGRRHLAELARRCHVSCVLVYDELEAQPPPPGRYRASDGERVLSFSANGAAWRRAFADRFARHREELTAFCIRQRIELIALRTDEEPASVLPAALPAARRSGRVRS
jgi:uncharacterized protein (DUF58 family)